MTNKFKIFILVDNCKYTLWFFKKFMQDGKRSRADELSAENFLLMLSVDAIEI